MAETDGNSSSALRFAPVTEDDSFWDRLGRGADLGESEAWVRVDIGTVQVYFRRDITDSGPAGLTGLCIIGDITAEALRSIPLVPLEHYDAAIVEGLSPTDLDPLKRTDYSEPADFYTAVALYYRVFAMQGRNPAKAIAEHSDVPAATVHAWIRETRIAGKLPPGRRGKTP